MQVRVQRKRYLTSAQKLTGKIDVLSVTICKLTSIGAFKVAG